MPKNVIDIRASKGISQALSDEHQRRWSEKQWENRLANTDMCYDITRRELNFEIVDGHIQKIDTSKSIDKKLREMCAARGMRYPNDPNPRRKPGDDTSKIKERNVCAQFIFQGSRERMHEIAFGRFGAVDTTRGADNSHVRRMPEIEQWAMDAYNWLGKNYGYENIASFICHLDETNPHIHAVLLPVALIKGKQRVSYDRVFGAETKLERSQKWKKMHDSYYEAVGKKWGLERGDSIDITGARHRSRKEWLNDLEAQIKSKQTAVKGLTSMINNLDKQVEEITSKISSLKKELADGRGNKETLEKTLRELNNSLVSLDKKMTDKREKLAKAETELEAVLKEKSQIENRDEKIRAEGYKSGRAAVIEEMTDVSGKWQGKDREPYTPTPEQYAKNYRNAKAKIKDLEGLLEKLKKETCPLSEREAWKWLSNELQQAPDAGAWKNLEVGFNEQGNFVCLGTYCGISFRKIWDHLSEENSLSDCLLGQNSLPYTMADAADTALRGLVAVMWDAFTTSAPVSSGGGGSGNNDLPRKKDEDWCKGNFPHIFRAAKAQLGQGKGSKIKR